MFAAPSLTTVTSSSDFWVAMLAGLVSCAVAWMLVPLVRRLAFHFNVIDRPEGRRVHVQATPRLGGLAVMLATIMSAALCLSDDAAGLRTIMPHLIMASLLTAVGAVDDVRGLRPALKLGGTVLAALIGTQLGLRIETITMPWGPSIVTGMFAVPITVLWIVSVCHAVNLIDGVDGLAGTVALVTALAAAFTRMQSGRMAPALLALALAGALIGFLRWNWTPAKIFLGDAGSLGIGGLMALLALVPIDRQGSMVRVLDVSSLLMLAYPIADTTLAVLRRWLRGVPISIADRGHIHHRLLDRGLPQPVPTVWLGAWSLAAGGVALAIRHTSNPQFRLLGAALGGTLLLIGLQTLRRLGVRELEVLAAAFGSLRRSGRAVIREHIVSSDAAEQLQRTMTLDEVDGVLTDCAQRIGLRGAELTRSSARRRITGAEVEGVSCVVWTLDWPLNTLPGPQDDPIVLRLYGAADGVIRPHTAARAAEALLPAIANWLTLPRQRELIDRRPATRRGRRAADVTTETAVIEFASRDSQQRGA